MFVCPWKSCAAILTYQEVGSVCCFDNNTWQRQKRKDGFCSWSQKFIISGPHAPEQKIMQQGWAVQPSASRLNKQHTESTVEIRDQFHPQWITSATQVRVAFYRHFTSSPSRVTSQGIVTGLLGGQLTFNLAGKFQRPLENRKGIFIGRISYSYQRGTNEIVALLRLSESMARKQTWGPGHEPLVDSKLVQPLELWKKRKGRKKRKEKTKVV